MSIRKDKIIVVDLEATCWEGFRAPEGQRNEIIEIGVCLLDPAVREISDKRSILVRPIESQVSEFCTELTTITPSMLDERGVEFHDACTILEKEYDSRNRLWASWGNWDHTFMKKQCRRRKVRYPFSKKHANMKRMFRDCVGERMPFMRALEHARLEPVGTHHRGDDDAWNTARLLLWLGEQYGMDIFRRYGW